MAKIDLRREKQAANERCANKFRTAKTSRKHLRKAERHERVLRRERAWLAATNIPRDERWPLA